MKRLLLLQLSISRWGRKMQVACLPSKPLIENLQLSQIASIATKRIGLCAKIPSHTLPITTRGVVLDKLSNRVFEEMRVHPRNLANQRSARPRLSNDARECVCMPFIGSRRTRLAGGWVRKMDRLDDPPSFGSPRTPTPSKWPPPSVRTRTWNSHSVCVCVYALMHELFLPAYIP